MAFDDKNEMELIVITNNEEKKARITKNRRKTVRDINDNLRKIAIYNLSGMQGKC